MFKIILAVLIVSMNMGIAAVDPREEEDKYKKIALSFSKEVGEIREVIEEASDDFRNRVRGSIRRFFENENPGFLKFLETNGDRYKIEGTERYDDPLFPYFSLFSLSVGNSLLEMSSTARNGDYLGRKFCWWRRGTLPENESTVFQLKEHFGMFCSVHSKFGSIPESIKMNKANRA